MGFELTPFRNGALSHCLRPLGQSVVVSGWCEPRSTHAAHVAWPMICGTCQQSVYTKSRTGAVAATTRNTNHKTMWTALKSSKVASFRRRAGSHCAPATQKFLNTYRGARTHDHKVRLEAGGWKLKVGGWKLEAGGWRLEAGRRRLETNPIDPTNPISPISLGTRPRRYKA